MKRKKLKATSGLKQFERSPATPLRAAATVAVPHAEMVQLFGLFTTGRHAEMETLALSLVARYARDGQAWKALGIAQLTQGKDALAALQEACALLPGDAEILSALGGCWAAGGDLKQAATCYRQALHARPGFAQVHSNLGDVLTRLGDAPAAEASCRQALLLQPGLASAHLNLGNAQMAQHRIDEAIISYRRALTSQPGLAEAHLALGRAFKQQGELAQATSCMRRAADIRPHHASTHDLLGVVLHEAGQLEAAAASLRTALRLKPGAAATHFHLANVLLDLGQAQEAVSHYQQALDQQPGQAEVLVNLGVALSAAGHLEQASACLQQALVLQPHSALAHGNLGNTLLAQGQMALARTHLEEAVAQAPGLAIAHRNLAHLFKTIGQPASALGHLHKALALPQAPLELHSEVLFVQNYLPLTQVSLDDRLACARRFGQAAEQRAQPFTAWPNPPLPDKPLRVGLVSADLREHPVGYFLESVLAHWASPISQTEHRLAAVAYANQHEADATTKRLQSHCHTWHAVAGLDDDSLARLVRDDGIDILIDLSGHTRRNRLPMLAYRPAPVQLSWLGYCATTGLDAVDAFLADPWIAPPGMDAAFTERVIRLPESFLCFTPPAATIPVGPLPALRAGLRFACFNQLAKMGDDVVDLWAQVLRALPDSALVLKAHALQDASVRAEVKARFVRHGVSPDQLLLQAAQADRAAYLAAYSEVDIALDPFPYPGGTTSLEALWMGVPVLTLPGASALSRQGASILHNLGLADWVATDAQDFVARAVGHASDLAALASVREGLRARLLQSPLCDAPRFAGHLALCLRSLWAGWCERGRPACMR